MANRCCFKDCNQSAHEADLRVKLWPPSDAPALIFWAHGSCFERVRKEGVTPDPIQEQGRIPSSARCVICGQWLPFIGLHPYAIEVEEESSPARYWMHAQCAASHIVDLSD